MPNSKEIERDLIGPARRQFESQSSLLHINGRTLVVGDLHGDLRAAQAAVALLKKGAAEHLLFLGDYVDRGKDSYPVLQTIIHAMLTGPTHVHMLRGNHETLWVNEKHGFKAELEKRGLSDLHLSFNEMFSMMPIAAIINGSVLAVHGGIPQEMPSIETIKKLPKGIMDPDNERDRILLGLIWNDPKEGQKGFGPNSERGYMRTFGSRVFHEFMENNRLEKMIRGHQRWPDGYRYFFEERLLSIFSCASYSPNVHTRAAIVEGSTFALIDL